MGLKTERHSCNDKQCAGMQETVSVLSYGIRGLIQVHFILRLTFGKKN